MQLELFRFDIIRGRFIASLNLFEEIFIKGVKGATLIYKQPAKRISIKKVSDRRSTSKQDNLILESILNRIHLEFFPESKELVNYKISWSTRRQKRTLASCNIREKKINVARELNFPEHEKWLEPLIYHEVCHVIVGRDKNSGRHCWHGRTFKQLESRHPLMKEFNHWVKSGGWRKAVMSERTKSWWREKKIESL